MNTSYTQELRHAVSVSNWRSASPSGERRDATSDDSCLYQDISALKKKHSPKHNMHNIHQGNKVLF